MQKSLIQFLSRIQSDRSWGTEELLVHTPLYTMKLLHRKAGSQGPLQYHRIKDESTYLLSGEALIWYDPGGGTLHRVQAHAGSAFRFPPGSVHREDAVTDCVFLEVSNPVFNDRVRVEERYGLPRPEPYGMPTTELEEVVVTDTWEKVSAFTFK